jgi:transposase
MPGRAHPGSCTGRPTKPLDITADERHKLELLARRPKSSQALAMRARIVLNCALELTNDKVAQKLNVTRPTVGKWRERFRLHRLEGLLDEPRPGAPRSITDDQVEAVVTTTLEAMPKQGTHWSTRLMARQAGLSQTAIVRIWGAFGLQPHRVEGFKFSKDPQFVEKVRDIVGLYMNPPENALVLCVDEKSQVQALNRTQPILPLGPGVPARQSHDYERHGVTSLFTALNAKTGATIAACHRRHRHQEFLRFLNKINASVPAEEAIPQSTALKRPCSVISTSATKIRSPLFGRQTLTSFSAKSSDFVKGLITHDTRPLPFAAVRLLSQSA